MLPIQINFDQEKKNIAKEDILKLWKNSTTLIKTNDIYMHKNFLQKLGNFNYTFTKCKF